MQTEIYKCSKEMENGNALREMNGNGQSRAKTDYFHIIYSS